MSLIHTWQSNINILFQKLLSPQQLNRIHTSCFITGSVLVPKMPKILQLVQNHMEVMEICPPFPVFTGTHPPFLMADIYEKSLA